MQYSQSALSHLWTTYGVLQDYEVQENDVKMKKAISAKTLFEDFVDQIETAVDSVATRVPYTREQICDYCIHNNGKRRDILRWRKGVALNTLMDYVRGITRL